MRAGRRTIISDGNNPGILSQNCPNMLLNAMRTLGKVNRQFHENIVKIRLAHENKFGKNNNPARCGEKFLNKGFYFSVKEEKLS